MTTWWRIRGVIWCAAVLVGVLTLAACTVLGGGSSKAKKNAQTAIVYLNQARKLVVEIAHAVEPGAVLKQATSDGPPASCRSPLRGFDYFSISRDFQAPSGKFGTSLLPALATELKVQGFKISPIETGGGYFDSVLGTRDKSVGVAAMGSRTTSLVRIAIDTQCGKASAADYDVGIEPSPSPT